MLAVMTDRERIEARHRAAGAHRAKRERGVDDRGAVRLARHRGGGAGERRAEVRQPGAIGVLVELTRHLLDAHQLVVVNHPAAVGPSLGLAWTALVVVRGHALAQHDCPQQARDARPTQ